MQIDGTDTFTYKADDGNSVNNESNTATVTITVDAVNDAPVTTDQSDTLGKYLELPLAGPQMLMVMI